MFTHGGFAAVTQVHESTLQQTLGIYYNSGLFPVDFSETRNINYQGKTIKISMNMFLNAPKLSLTMLYIHLKVSLSGRIEVTIPGKGTISRSVKVSTNLYIKPSCLVDENGIAVRLQIDDLKFGIINLLYIKGTKSDEFEQIVFSPGSKQMMDSMLSKSIGAINSISPPLMVPLIDEIGLGSAVKLKRIVSDVSDGYLTIGLDVSPGILDISTWGDINLVQKIIGKSSIAVGFNPVLLPIILWKVSPEINAKADKHGVTINSLSISTEEENLYISGHASKDGGGGNFSLRVQPMLGTEDRVVTYHDEYGEYQTIVYPGSNDVWMRVYDVNLDIELPWWVYVLVIVSCAVAIPMAPAILMTVTSIVDSLKGKAISQIGNAGTGIGSNSVFEMPLPGTTEPIVRFSLSMIKAGNVGMRSRIRFYVQKPEKHNRILGPNSIGIYNFLFNNASVKYTKIPDLTMYHKKDPFVKVRWQVRKNGDNKALLSKDMYLYEDGSLELEFNLNHLGKFDINTTSGLTISCRVYKPEGEYCTDYENQTSYLHFADTLDRLHPYVRWEHKVHIPVISEDEDGNTKYTDLHVYKKSKIHRTSIPGRCYFADANGGGEYHDELPFPKSEIIKNRKQLCDYCFFGGPDKDVPLI